MKLSPSREQEVRNSKFASISKYMSVCRSKRDERKGGLRGVGGGDRGRGAPVDNARNLPPFKGRLLGELSRKEGALNRL